MKACYKPSFFYLNKDNDDGDDEREKSRLGPPLTPKVLKYKSLVPKLL